LLQWIVIGAFVFIAILLISSMDRGPPDDKHEDDGPQVIDSDDVE
jgi:hypothetical protein